MNGFESGMDNRFRVATLARIPIYVTLWFLLLLGFIVLQAVIDRDLAAVIWMLVLFAIIVLHELGHALTARHFGNQILGITLHLFGGVMQHSGQVTRRQAILISLAGPAVNLALLAPSAVIYFGKVDLGFIGGVLALAVFTINLVLLVFNLLPIYPMDGGQVARALLARWMGPVRGLVFGSGLSLLVGAGALVFSILAGWGVIAMLLIGTLLITNVGELRRGLYLQKSLGDKPQPLWPRARGWIRRKLSRRKLQARDFPGLLEQALSQGLDSIVAEDRRALIWHKAQLDLRIQQRGFESLSEQEQELFVRYHELFHGKTVQ